MGRYDEALDRPHGLEAMTEDRALVYLAHLFRGMALENRGTRRRGARRRTGRRWRSVRARTPPRSASPRSSSGAGAPTSPRPMVDALLKTDDPRRDPWWSYYAADWRFWYPRIERVRSLLKPNA